MRNSGGRRIGLGFLWAAISCFALASSASADDTIFGPATCQRTTGAPTVYSFSFPATEPSRGFIFKVYNGGLEDATYELVSSSTITLNDAQIVGPSNFNQNVTYLEVPVVLQAQNTLSVEVRGKPGGAIILKIHPFVVIDSPTQGQTFSAGSVDIAGHLYSEAVGITASGVAGTVSGSTFSVNAIPLVEGANLMTATAVRADGFIGQATVTVLRDSIPPAITILSPQEGSTLASPTVDISGSVDDPSATIFVNGSAVALVDQAFSVSGAPLQPGPNTILIEARDSLGNRSSQSVHVTYAPPPPTVSLTASPVTILEGSSATLSWSSENAAACSIEPGIGTVGTAGSAIISPAATTTYTFSCAGAGGTATAQVTVTVTYPAPTAALSAQPATVIAGTSSLLSWTTTDGQSCSIDNGIGAVPCSGAASVSPSTTTTYTLTVSGPGGTTSAGTTIMVDPAGVQVRISAVPETIQPGQATTLSWQSNGATRVIVEPTIGAVAPEGTATASPAVTTLYRVTAIGEEGVAVATVRVVVEGQVAALSEGSFGARYQDLVPVDATVTSYNEKRFALVTGRVLDVAGAPIPGVKVTIHLRSDLGTVTTDADGRYTIPVEGGGPLTLDLGKPGLMPTQRTAVAGWNDIVAADTVVMQPEDATTTAVRLDGDPSSVIVHAGTPVTDESGTRTATLVLTGDTMVYAQTAFGEVEVRAFDLHATEYSTPEAMPAALPPTSGFTYCVNLTAGGLERVRFSRPVTLLVDNFLGFNVGTLVPAGYYDFDKATWIPAANGRIVRLLDTDADGVADGMDSTGDGLADDLNGNGSTLDEAAGLLDAARYPPGASFMRLAITHLTPWDCNWPWGPPPGAPPPGPPGPPPPPPPGPPPPPSCGPSGPSGPGGGPGDDNPGPRPTISTNSYTDIFGRVYHADIPVTGTGTTLHYASDRVPSYATEINVPAIGASVHPLLRSIIVRVKVAGRTLETTLPAAPNQVARLSWDGLDHLGRPVPGRSRAIIEIGHVYPGFYYSSSETFTQAFAQVGAAASAIPTRREVALWKTTTLDIERFPAFAELASGWTLSGLNQMLPEDPTTVYTGDGRVIRQDLRTLRILAGNYSFDAYGSNGSCGEFCYPQGLAVDAAGYLYVGDVRHHRVVKISPEGVVTRIAGTGSSGYSGDGGPALSARFSYPSAVAVDPAGNVYIHDSGNVRIRKVSPDGTVTTVMGNGQSGFSPDNTPAVQARLGIRAYDQSGIGVDRWGNLYVAEHDNHRIRKISPDGLLTTIAGTGVAGDAGDGLALNSQLDQPWSIAVDGAGNIYFSEDKGYRLAVKKITPDGRLIRVAGGSGNLSGFGIPALQAYLDKVTAVHADEAGNVYFVDRTRGVCRVDPGGTLTSVPGGWQPSAVVTDPGGVLHILNSTTQVVQRLDTPGSVQGIGGVGDQLLTDGGLGYLFSAGGLHTATYDLRSRSTLLSFGYADRRLVSITDRFGNATTIDRDGMGRATAIIAPDGQRTDLDADQEGRLRRVIRPDLTEWRVAYDERGLISEKWDPNGNRFVYQFDEGGHVADLFDPEGGHWNFTRSVDPAGKTSVTVTNGEGEGTLYEAQTAWDGGFMSQTIRPDGSVSTYSRAAGNDSDGVVLGCGMTQTRSYALDPLWRYKYPSGGTVTSPGGRTRTTSSTRAYQDTNSDGREDRYTSTMTVNGQTTTTVDATLTGVLTTTSPQGRVSTLTYDPGTGLATQVAVPGLYPTSFTYDARGRLSSTTTGTRTTLLAYDSAGMLGSLLTPEGRQWSYTYDALGRLLTERRPDGSEVGYQYDPNGNMTLLVNPNQVGYGFGYTANNQRSLMAQPLSGNYAYRHDLNRRLEAVTMPSGRTITNAWSLGRLDSITTPEGVTTFSYACNSKLTGVARGGESITYGYDGTLLTGDTRGGSLNTGLTYTWNNDFAPATISYAGATTIYGYDGDGLLTTAEGYAISRDPQNGFALAVSGNGMLLERTWSGYGELEGEQWTAGGRVPYRWTTARDEAGRITHREEQIDGVTIGWDYGYDDLGRLTSATRNGVSVERYTYDVNGNRLTGESTLLGTGERAYSHSAEDHLLTAGSDTWQFDVDGFLQSRTSGAGTTSYSYSSRGELQTAWLPDGRILSYEHDPLGRRIVRKIDDVIVEKYLWEGMTKLLAVYDGNDALKARFIYADSRMPVAMTAGGITYALAYDQVGSLRAVIGADGAIVKRIDYDSFGNIVADSNPSFGMPIGFAGGLQDRDAGLVRFGYRDYAPEVGRFVAKDPIDFAGGDTNLYGYVMNDPVNGSDSSGLAGPQRIPPELIPPSLPPSPDLPDSPLPGSGCNDSPGCTPTFHPDEYWGCIISTLGENLSSYATGILVTTGGVIVGGPAGFTAAGIFFAGELAMANYHASQCRRAATHCN